MSFIRSRQVDISLYLPVSLTKSDEYKAGLDAESREHERMRIALLDIEKQFYVKTVDWGINLWEDLYAINQDRSISNLINRRDVVIAKMGPPSVVNEPFMDRLVNAYVADKKAEIVSHIDEYRIEILYRGGTILDYDNLRKSIREYLPAHLGYKLVTFTSGDLYFHAAGSVQNYKKITVDMDSSVHFEAKDTMIHYAGQVVHNYRKLSISGGVLNHG